MHPELRDLLEAAFADDPSLIEPMPIRNMRESADEGAALVPVGTDTATSLPRRDKSRGTMPGAGAGAFGVLLDRAHRPVGIAWTVARRARAVRRDRRGVRAGRRRAKPDAR